MNSFTNMEYKIPQLEPRGFGNEYYNHKIFNFLDDVNLFYSFLSDRSADYFDGVLISGRYAFNGQVYNSIGGTIESIKVLSYCGRLNDVFALTRKLEDAILIDLYKTILLKKEEMKIVETDIPIKDILKDSVIRTWTRDTYKLFKYGDLEKIKSQIKSEDVILGDLLKLEEEDNFRTECNNNVHYNSWNNFRLNVHELHNVNKQGVKTLEIIYKIVCKIFVTHFSYTYIQHPEYYSSLDYVDDLDKGRKPIDGSQYWVTPIVQEVFDKYVKTEYNDVADYLVKMNLMELK